MPRFSHTPGTAASALILANKKLCAQLSPLRFAEPVTHVYNPLLYAGAVHRQYVERFADAGASALLVGMNPGPYGMAQTGVPFGEVTWVRDWLRLDAHVGVPTVQHPKRPILGFSCRRSEVSGARLWTWAHRHFGTPKRFFARLFVYNYCPLAFMEASGRNRTPDKLRHNEREAVFAACDAALAAVVEALRLSHVVGIGAFAHLRLRRALPLFAGTMGQVMHPSPANPLANRDWDAVATRGLRAQGIDVP